MNKDILRKGVINIKPDRSIRSILIEVYNEGEGWEQKKGGEKQMPEYPKEIEVERVTNLIRGFGWEKVKEEIVGEELILTIKKKFLKPSEVPEELPST